MLRGLCEHYAVFGDDFSLQAIRRITENLYLPKRGRFSSYPIERSIAKDGGAGTDSVVLEGGTDTLCTGMYEAYFCCTMRLAEGLWYINANRELFAACTEGKVTRQGRIYADGDILYAQISGGGEAYAKQTIQIDGLTLSPIVKYYLLPREIIETTRQKILF